MSLKLSIILPVRDMESWVAVMVRDAVKVAATTGENDTAPGEDEFEVLALDESSGDNTLSVLSVLHGQIAQLRTLQDLEPGTAIGRASRVARGDVWLICDRPVDVELASWGLQQVLGGHRAAIVPGQILTVDRELGRAALATLQGGLMSAQRNVMRHLRRAGERPAFSPTPDRRLAHRAVLYVRGRLGTLGLGWLDRPLRTSGSLPDDGLL